jgi:hypothetical protein
MWQRETAFPQDLRWRLAQLGPHTGSSLDWMMPDVPLGRSRGEWRRTWHFPTQTAAERWNAEWDRVLASPRSLHPAFTRIGGSAIADRLLDALARVAGAVLAEEVSAGSPCPYVARGWSYRLVLQHSVHRVGREEMEQTLVLKLVADILGSGGALRWSSDTERSYPSDLIPPAVTALWSLRRWSPVEENYA